MGDVYSGSSWNHYPDKESNVYIDRKPSEIVQPATASKFEDTGNYYIITEYDGETTAIGPFPSKDAVRYYRAGMKFDWNDDRVLIGIVSGYVVDPDNNVKVTAPELGRPF